MAIRLSQRDQKSIELIEHWVRQHGKIWSRKILYELVSHQLVKDTSETSYNWVCNRFKQFRDEGLVPYAWFADKKSVEENVDISTVSFNDEFRYITKYYLRDSRLLQKYYVELWTEKDLSQDTHDLLEEYNVGLVVVKGYGGDVFLHWAEKRLGEVMINHEKSVVILFLSDYDPEGEYIVECVRRRINPSFKLEKIAIRKHQIKSLGLISNIGYKERPKSKKYLKCRYVQDFFRKNTDLEPDGIVQYELDQLKVETLMEILKSELGKYVDLDLKQKNAEASQQEVERWLVEHYKKMDE